MMCSVVSVHQGREWGSCAVHMVKRQVDAYNRQPYLMNDFEVKHDDGYSS